MWPSEGSDLWVIRLAQTTVPPCVSLVHSGTTYSPLSFMLGMKKGKEGQKGNGGSSNGVSNENTNPIMH